MLRHKKFVGTALMCIFIGMYVVIKYKSNFINYSSQEIYIPAFVNVRSIANLLRSSMYMKQKIQSHKNESVIQSHENERVTVFPTDMSCGSARTMTSVKFSRLLLDSIDRSKIIITVVTFYPNNTLKLTGGDVIVIMAEQKQGQGRVSARVTDNLNGTYTGTVPVLWNGEIVIRAKMLSSAKNTCLRYKSLLNYNNVVFSLQNPWGINGLFSRMSTREKSRCGPTANIYGYKDVCNFTTINDNVPFYCGAPSSSKLKCSDIYSFGTGPFYIPGIQASEKIQYPGHAVLDHTVTVNIKSHVFKYPTMHCRDVQKNETWTRYITSGFFSSTSIAERKNIPSAYENRHLEHSSANPSTWKPFVCIGLHEHSVNSYRQCLQGKTVAFLGDSTVRQYYEYICKLVVNGKCFLEHGDYGPQRSYHSNWVLTTHNVSLLYRKHELPFHNPDARPNNIKSMPSMITELADGDIPGEKLTLVVNYFSHYLAYQAPSFRLCISNLVTAIKYILIKKPKVKILFKGPHVAIDDRRWFDAKLSLLFRDIIFEEFDDIMNDVIYLDTWDVTVTHNSQLLHPSGQCMKSQIEQFMSFNCD